MEEARRILNCHQPETVLEIGPGWGNFTMNLAETYPDLTCLDISPDVLNFIKKVIQKEKGLQIKTVCSKWEDFEVTEPYDAVFGYNCFYRMLDLKQCIEKMNKAARKICMMGMGTGERRIYIYFINLLFQLGIAADVRVIPLYETPGSASSLESQPGILVYWKPVYSLKELTDRH